MRYIVIIIFAIAACCTLTEGWNEDEKEEINAQNNETRQSRGDELQITGIRVESCEREIKNEDDGVQSVMSDLDFELRVFGNGITTDTLIAFTKLDNEYGGACLYPTTKLFAVDIKSISAYSAVFKVKLPPTTKRLYICAKIDTDNDESEAKVTVPLVHQGRTKWLQLGVYQPIFPLWLTLVIIVFCLGCSFLFSGLNLGLMSLDRTELRLLKATGTPKEREYANTIQHVRSKGNFLLCSILLGNTMVNAILTIMLDTITSGVLAVVFATVIIVLFGEITPQAICSRHGLAVGANTIYITKALMAITFPMAYPTSKIFDLLLGEEIGNVYNRERIKELVILSRLHSDLDKSEVDIISGALELHKKTVADIMTLIDDIFMLPIDAILDFETVSEIMKSGYSRVPVYDGDRRNIVTILYIKDLAFIDTDDNTALRTLCEFYQNPVYFVDENTTLDVLFHVFKQGERGHLAIVRRQKMRAGAMHYETVGLTTLEDVIEELIQAEIVDETDVFVDNRSRTRSPRGKMTDFTVFAERPEKQTVHISPQLTLAAFQYLRSSVDAFRSEKISDIMLRRLLNQDVIHAIKIKGKTKDDPSIYIYHKDEAVDFFVLILEGRVEVTVGNEGLHFESGPFTYFGSQALTQHMVTDNTMSMHSLNLDATARQTFVPDYSVRAVSDVTYLAIKRSIYFDAIKATLRHKSFKADQEDNDDKI